MELSEGKILDFVVIATTIITFGKMVLVELLSSYTDIHERVKSARELKPIAHHKPTTPAPKE